MSENETIKIKEVAVKVVGYQDTYLFSRIYKKHCGH
jgi:YesN/AraC family two-component response regulator